MDFEGDPLDDYVKSIDPRIHAIVAAADRRDYLAVPALRQALEQALALFTDSQSVISQAAAQFKDRPESERVQASLHLLSPMTLFDELVFAAMKMPHTSLEPVLKDLSKRVSHEGVRDALAKVRSLTAQSGRDANIKNLGIPAPAQTLEDGALARMVIANDFAGIMDAVTEAPIGDLLAGLAECVRKDQRHLCEDLVNACHRYPEAEVLFVVRPWLTDADPCRREAVAMALGRDGDDGVAPDRRAIENLYRFLADRTPDVVIAALRAIGQRTNRNFTSANLDRMRSACERHLSVKVREAYSDVFYSPYVGHGPASGAFDAWCRMTRDAAPRLRYLACGRLRDCFLGDQDFEIHAGPLRAVLNAAKTDSSANVRFVALAGLTDLGEQHVVEIERELTALADRLDGSNLEDRTGEEDDGLDLLSEMLSKPSRRYVPALERIASMYTAAGFDHFDDLLQDCRQAPREGFLSRFLPV